MKSSAFSNRWGIGALTGLVCLGIVGCSSKDKPAAEAVATVGPAHITVNDFEDYLGSRPAGLQGRVSKETVRQLIDELIVSEVLYQEAIRREIDQDPGVRQQIRQLLAQRLLYDAVVEQTLSTEITDPELEAFFSVHRSDYTRPEQVRLADVYLALPDGATDADRVEQRRKAEQILDEAMRRAGERFAFRELIQRYSDQHPLYALGDTGFFDRQGRPAGLAEPLVQAGFSLGKTGSVFPSVVDTPTGFHIVMRVGHRDAVDRAYHDVRDQLVQRMRGERLQTSQAMLIADLRKRAAIQVDETSVARLAAKTQSAQVAQTVDDASERRRPTLPGMQR
jgi:parvulin-like peptidyl-prolyl isomerase